MIRIEIEEVKMCLCNREVADHKGLNVAARIKVNVVVEIKGFFQIIPLFPSKLTTVTFHVSWFLHCNLFPY